MKKILEERTAWFEDKAREIGLDFFPINWEVVPEEVLLEVMSYGLPTRARHWSYGQSYQYQKIQGEMGASKVYELVLNNDPSYAFLLETNSDIANTMVIAHVIGHVHFFKHNYLFKQTDRRMVYHAAERAARVEEYITQYGLEKVEHIMDIAFALDKNIDWHKGVHRKPYPKKKKVLKKKKSGEFDDLYGIDTSGYNEVTVNAKFPPTREYDLLWFLSNHADLEPWEKDIFEIVREESYYFYPQYCTKIMNEGLASYVHAELMYLLNEDMLSSSEYIEFVKIHERVVQPGGSKLDINPYFLGFTILNDIKEKWDAKHKDGQSDVTGFQKILEVCAEEDDISFLRRYLTQEIVDRLQMFSYKTHYDRSKGEYIQIESTNVKDVVESQISNIYNYRSPLIYVEKASTTNLELVHESKNIGTLDPKHIEKVSEYLYEIWQGVVDIETVDDAGDSMHYTFDEEGFSHHAQNWDPSAAD
jgi:stage V sporulation protein R